MKPLNCESLQKDMQYLFECNFFDDSFDPEGNEEHQNLAETVLERYNWDDIYNWFFQYLTVDCKSAESVFNALNLYWCYCFDEYPVRNPYELIGYILFRIDLNVYWDEYGDFTDSFANVILQQTGNLDITRDPYYQCWKDPLVLKAIDEWKQKE